MAKEVGLLDSPFAFEWVDAVAVSFQMFQDDLEEIHVIRPQVAKAGDVVDVYFDVVDKGEDGFHNLRGDVRRGGNAHGETMVAVQSNWSGDGAKFLAFVVQFKGIVQHGDVEF